MKKFIESGHCRSRAHCHSCRSSAQWRESTGAPEACPVGITLDAIPAPRAGGPGTELKLILASLGIEPGNCSCNSMATKMDTWGPAGCEEHMEDIVSAIESAANQRGWMRVLPFKRLGARGLVALAIGRAIDGCAKTAPGPAPDAPH